MNTNPVLWLQAYIIGVLIFLVSVTASRSIRSGLIRLKK
jgi:uncharacterized protein (DUF983 family)